MTYSILYVGFKLKLYMHLEGGAIDPVPRILHVKTSLNQLSTDFFLNISPIATEIGHEIKNSFSLMMS